MPASSYEAQQETAEQSHTSAVRDITEARKKAATALSRAEVSGVPPTACVIDPEPPEPRSSWGESSTRPPWESRLSAAHGTVLRLWSEVRPYRDRVSEVWDQPLLTVRKPVEGEWQRRFRNGNRHWVQGLAAEPVEISLASLGDWRYQEVTLRSQIPTRHRGTKQQSRSEKVHLPIIGCQAVYEAITDILEELDLLAEVREASSSDTDPGVPDNVEAWE